MKFQELKGKAQKIAVEQVRDYSYEWEQYKDSMINEEGNYANKELEYYGFEVEELYYLSGSTGDFDFYGTVIADSDMIVRTGEVDESEVGKDDFIKVEISLSTRNEEKVKDTESEFSFDLSKAQKAYESICDEIEDQIRQTQSVLAAYDEGDDELVKDFILELGSFQFDEDGLLLDEDGEPYED